MKKLMIAAFAVAFAAVAQAACVQWKMTATAAEESYSVYVFASAVAGSYDSVDQLTSTAATEVGTIAGYTARGVTTYRTDASITATFDDVSKADLSKLYFVIISGNDATEYKYGEIDTGSLAYDPQLQESASGTLAITTANITGSGTIGEPSSVPEPTSALMLLVGLAGLALKRKVA